MKKYMQHMNLKYIVIPAFFLLISSLAAPAQDQDTEAYFTAVRNNKSVSSFSFNGKKEARYIAAISKYLADTVPAIRAEAYYLLGSLGQQSRQKSIRRDAVSLLLRGFRDKDAGIKGRVENVLVRFNTEDFDRTAMDTLRSLLAKLPPLPGKLFRLAGYLNLHDQAPKIKAYIEGQPPLASKDRWAGYLALARMGDQQALDIILNRVRTFGINDDVVYEIFPDLVYTRSYRAIHYLEEVTFSNEKNCTSPHADSQAKINCAYRVIELLAPIISDYPVALDASGDLATSDYNEALEKIRAWFTRKDGTYEIIRNTF